MILYLISNFSAQTRCECIAQKITAIYNYHIEKELLHCMHYDSG
jgi:hypothetical protein